MKNSSRDGRLITLQYCSCFCHTLTWISHGCTCISHPNPPSHLPLYPIPLGRYSFVGMLLRVQNVSVCCGQVKESNSQLGKKKREMGIPDHLTCLLRYLYAGQEVTVRTRHGTMDWFQIGKGVHQGCILSPCLFSLYAEYIMQNARVDEAPAGITIARRNISNFR